MSKGFNFLFLILIISSQAYSQPFVDIINFRYQNFPHVKYVGNDNKALTINQLTGNINLPIQLKNKGILFVGGTFDELQFQTSIREEQQKKLYSFLLQVGYLKTWKGGRWKTLLMALPKLNSDQFVITKDAYQQGGILLFTYVKNEKLNYKFGLYYNREFFGNYFIPLLGIEWKPNPKLNIYGVLPGNMNVEYQINKKLYGGISYQCITSSYRLHNTVVKSFVRNGDRFWGHNQYRIFINYHLTKSLVLFTEVGYTFWRKFEVYKSRREKVDNYLFSKTKDGILINAGMAFRIRL